MKIYTYEEFTQLPAPILYYTISNGGYQQSGTYILYKWGECSDGVVSACTEPFPITTACSEVLQTNDYCSTLDKFMAKGECPVSDCETLREFFFASDTHIKYVVYDRADISSLVNKLQIHIDNIS